MNSRSADHADVAEAAAELLRVLKNVRRASRADCGLPVRSRPSAHQPRAVHVNQRVRDVQILGDELTEERLVRQAEALMQIVDVAVARVPAARRQIDQPLEAESSPSASPPAGTSTVADFGTNCQPRIASIVVRPAGTSTSASPSMWK